MKELRQKRREILTEIKRLDKKRCEKCGEGTPPGAKSQKSYYECDCKVAVRIRELGDQLLKLVTKRVDPVDEFLKKQPKTLTLEIYQEIKKVEIDGKKITDVAIAQNYGIDPKKFHTWKKREWKNEIKAAHN